MATSDKSFNGELLESIFKTSKKTIQEYVREIERNNRYRSCRQDTGSGYILDDRARLIDLYEACLQQDAHIRSVVETLESQILGDRYMLARVNEKGKYIKDVANSLKIQGSQFDKIIKGIVESKLYGYTLLEIMPHTDPRTGRLAEVNIIERRNVLPDQKTVLKRQGLWEPHWDLHDPAYYRCYVLVNSGDLGLFSATTPLILAKKFTVANYVNFSHTYGQPIIHGKTVSESNADRKRLANEIANAAQNKVVVTGIEDEVDIKTFTMSNSEKIYTGLIEFVNKEVANLVLGSESMAGGQPGIAVGTAPQHQSVASCFCKHPLSVSYCQDITVTDDRYFYSRFDSGDNLPVCPAIIKLFPCPAVYCYGCYARLFCQYSYFFRIDMFRIPAGTEFHSNRNRYSVCHPRQNFVGQLRIFHQSRAFAIIDDLRHRAAHIKVDHICTVPGDYPCGFSQFCRNRTKKLDRRRSFTRIDAQHIKSFDIFIKQPLGADHFRNSHTAAKFSANDPKGQICDSGHRRQQQRYI